MIVFVPIVIQKREVLNRFSLNMSKIKVNNKLKCSFLNIARLLRFKVIELKRGADETEFSLVEKGREKLIRELNFEK